MSKSVTPINTPNVSTYFFPADDNWETRSFQVAASGWAIADWTMMAFDVSGSSPTWYIIVAPTAQTNGKNFVGILQQRIATTDDDYATVRFVKVRAPKTRAARAYFTVWSGTFTQADVWRMCALYSDSKSVAVDTNGIWVVIDDYIDSTHGLCHLAPEVVTS